MLWFFKVNMSLEYFKLMNLSGKNEIFHLPDHLFYR